MPMGKDITGGVTTLSGDSLQDPTSFAIGPRNTYSTLANENAQIYRDYRNAFSGYLDTQALDWQFALMSMQWSDDEVDALLRNGQAPVVFNHLRRVIEQYTALLAGRSPKFNVFPRVAGTMNVARTLADICDYIWQTSGATLHLQSVILDMVARGSSGLYAYLDQNADYGRGDIQIGYLHPREMYFDPAIRDRLARDAEHLVISGLRSRSRLAQLFPDKLDLIEKISPDYMDEDYEAEQAGVNLGQQMWAAGDRLLPNRDLFRLIDRYTKVLQPHILVEDPLTGEAVDLVPKTEEWRIKDMVARMDAAIKARYPDSEGIMVPVREVNVWRVHQVTSIGWGVAGTGGESDESDVLVDRIIPISEYPAVPFFNNFNGSPFAMSEVRDLKHPQEFVNKMLALLVKQMTAVAAGGTWVVPEESGAKEEISEKGNLPSAQINVQGPKEVHPYKIPPPPMTEGEFLLIDKLAGAIDSVSGMDARLQGQHAGDRESAALRSIRGEELTHRPSLKMGSIDAALSLLGGVVVEMAQAFYRGRKIFNISDAAGRVRQAAIDQSRGLVQASDGAAIFGSINVGRYGVYVAPGSTKMQNRQERRQEALVWKQAGVLDNAGVAAFLDDPVFVEAAKRMDALAQLQQQVQQQAEELKKLERARSVAENEALNSRKQVELAQLREQLERDRSAFNHRLMTLEKNVGIAAGAIKADLQAAAKVAKADMNATAKKAEAKTKGEDNNA